MGVALGCSRLRGGIELASRLEDFHDAQTPMIIIIVALIVFGFWHRIRAVRRQTSG